MTLEEVVSVVQLAAPPILGAIAWYMKGLTTSVKGIEDELRKLNGRMVKIEEWRNLHDRIDEEREERAAGERREIREDLRHTQEMLVQRQLHDAAQRREKAS